MKVYIGPYPRDWVTTVPMTDSWYEWRYKKYDFEVEEAGVKDRWDRLVDRLSLSVQWILNRTINKVLRGRKRKIRVRIDRHDTWGMDTTLGHIILPMLKQLRATKHGSPWVDDEDVPHMAKIEDPDDQHADVHVRWDWVLGEMIWAFEQVVDSDEHKNYYVPYEDGEELDRVSFEDSLGKRHFLLTEEEARRMGKYDPDLHSAYQERVSRGLALFGKYYQNLWD